MVSSFHVCVLVNLKEVEVDLEMQAKILRISVGGHRNVTETIAPIELRVDKFVGREQKHDEGAVNGVRIVWLS
jgi:hypothetical protein